MNDYGYTALFWDHQTADKLSVISASQYLDVKPVMNISLLSEVLLVTSTHCRSLEFISVPLQTTDIVIIPKVRCEIDVCISECFLFHLHGGVGILSK